MNTTKKCINHSGVASYALSIFTTGEWQKVYYCTLCKNSKPIEVQSQMIFLFEVKRAKKGKKAA